jgi:predicted lipid-binding transport protein (Tim44 family)
MSLLNRLIHSSDRKDNLVNLTRLIAVCMVCALIGTPTVSFAKARGGGGGYSSGSRSNGTSQGFGSRGSRTYDQNGAKPIEQTTTARPTQSATGNTAPAQAPSAPQPSFLQRHPLMAGIAAGVAGSWIGHMLFGATDSSAKTNESGEHTGAAEASSGVNFTGILLVMLLAGATLYYVMRVRRVPAPVLSGLTRRSTVSESLLRESSPATLRTATVDTEVTDSDKAAFQQLLIDVQTAWGTQDLTRLRRCVTPEMLTYFSTALAEQTSREIENHVEDVVLGRADVRESWAEDGMQYVTVTLHWSARDYSVSLTKKRGEPGYLVEGNEETPAETSEVWTFMRYQNGKWLLSAIQQPE